MNAPRSHHEFPLDDVAEALRVVRERDGGTR